MLETLLQQRKFDPREDYTGVDQPEDLAPLTHEVNSAITDVQAMLEPRDAELVRQRLSVLIDNTDLFATEDRDEVYRYVVRIWRAAGFTQDSGLFALSDDSQTLTTFADRVKNLPKD